MAGGHRAGHDSSPAWSPDGKTLGVPLFHANGKFGRCTCFSMEGGEAKKLTNAFGTSADFGFSGRRDGKSIGFTSERCIWTAKDDACKQQAR